MVKPYALYVRAIAASCLAAPLLLAAYYTGSRGGILATAAMVGMFITSRFKINLKKLILAAALGGVALMAAPSYLTDTKDANHSAQGRVDMWAKGLEMVQNNPLFGIGVGQAGYEPPLMWGVYITNFVFFIGVSHVGALMSAILRLTGAEAA